MSTLRLSRRVVTVLTAAASLAAPICVQDASASGADDSDVFVESTGDQTNAVTLPPPALVGQATQSVTTVNLSVGTGGQQFDLALQMDLASEVTQVFQDGGYVAVFTIEAVRLSNSTGGVEEPVPGYSDLGGAQFQRTYDRIGRVVAAEVLNPAALSDVARQAVEGFTANLQSAQFVYPNEPIGVGAKWTADLEILMEGLAIPTTYGYELTDVSGGRYTMSMTYDSEFDLTFDGVETSGTVVGAGTVTASVDNPLDVSANLRYTIDATSGGVAISAVIETTVQSTVAVETTAP